MLSPLSVPLSPALLGAGDTAVPCPPAWLCWACATSPCPGFAPLPRKHPWAPPQGCGCGRQSANPPSSSPSSCPEAGGLSSQRALLCSHSPTENPCPCAQEGRDWGCGLCQDTGATEHQRCQGLLWQSAEAQGGSRAPQNRSGQQAEAGGSPQPWWHQGIFIYTKWSSSIRRSASSALAGAFLVPWSPWGGGELRHPGALSPWGSLEPLPYIAWGCLG